MTCLSKIAKHNSQPNEKNIMEFSLLIYLKRFQKQKNSPIGELEFSPTSFRSLEGFSHECVFFGDCHHG